MHARTSHIPSCDAIPAPGRWRARTPFALVAAALLLPMPVAAQQTEVRARDLSIIEDVLVETIQDAIQVTVRAVNTENLEAQEMARQNEQAVPIRYVFRSGGQTQARGMFLEDYGAIFTVQVPSMSYTFSTFFSGDGNTLVVRPDSVQSVLAEALGQQAQLRAQMDRMNAEIRALSARLQRETREQGAETENAVELRAHLEASLDAFAEAQRAYEEYAAEQETPQQPSADSRRARVSGGGVGGVEEMDRSNRYSGLRVLINASPEDLAAAEDLAQQQRNQIEGAIIEAVVESLGQYGHIMHGLDEDDRLAVVLLPSSYLNPMGSWARATQRDQEFIISVRFRDVLDRDRGALPAEDFRGRIRIERRLGQPHQQQ
jgi:hypothetical protein